MERGEIKERRMRELQVWLSEQQSHMPADHVPAAAMLV